MIKITVFKDEAKWSTDLRKSALKCGLNNGNTNAWNDAKEITSKVDYTQSINSSLEFMNSRHAESNARAIAHDIVAGRNYRVELV